MNKLLTLKKFLKVNTIFFIPFLLLTIGLIFINNYSLNIRSLSESYVNIIFIALFFPIIFLFYRVIKQIYTLFFQAKFILNFDLNVTCRVSQAPIVMCQKSEIATFSGIFPFLWSNHS